MGSDSSKATGTDFDANQKNRERDNAAEDLPSIPYVKQKEITAEITKTLKASIYFANYKRAFRGYLRKRPERNQMGAMFRIMQNSRRDGSMLGLPKDSYDEVVDRCVINLAPQINDDVIDFLTERRKVRPDDSPEKKQREAERNITIIFRHLTDEILDTTAKKLYEKYSRGADFEASDTEIDDEQKRKLAAAKQERLKKEAEQRQKQAEEWAREAAAEEAQQEARMAAVQQRQAEQRQIQQRDEELF